MATLAKLLVALGIDAAGVDEGVGKAQSSLSKLGSGMAKVGAGLSAGLTAPLVAVAKTILDVGSDFDSAMDSIRTTTGATGDTLSGLGDDMRAVFRSIPTDMDTASQAIGLLNQRTGQTGEGLQELAKTTILLADITGGDLEPIIASTTRAFGDWGVEAENQVSTLDLFYKVSQSTGIGVDQLANKLVQFGAPLRQMGFDLDTSAALLGKWEKEGVNAELVLGSLRIALVKMAKEGITDTKAALIEITQRIKDAGSVGEANALAMEFFGAKAGPDMAAAIREGRFEIEGFLAQLAASPETIQGAATSTFDMAENFAILKNRVVDALIPLGVKFFAALQNIVPLVAIVVTKIVGLITAFTNLPAGVQQSILIFLGLLAALGPVIGAVGGLIAAFGAIPGIIATVGGALATVLPILLPIVAIAAALYLAWTTNFLGIRDKTAEVFAFLQGLLPVALEAITSIISGALALIKAIFTGDWATVQTIVMSALSSIQGAISAAWDFLTGLTTSIWNGITSFIASALTSIVASITGNTDTARSTVQSAFSTIQTIAETVWNAIQTIITVDLAIIRTVIEAGLAFIKAAWEDIWTGIKTLAETIWENIRLVIDTALTLIKGLITVALQVLSGDWEGAWNTVKTTLATVWDNMLSIATNSVTGLVSGILSILGGLADGVFAAGEAVARRFGEGILAALNWALDAARAVAAAIADLLPGSDAKEGPLSHLFDSGRALPITIGEGIANAADFAIGLVRDMVIGIGAELAPLKEGGGAAGIGGGLPLLPGLGIGAEQIPTKGGGLPIFGDLGGPRLGIGAEVGPTKGGGLPVFGGLLDPSLGIGAEPIVGKGGGGIGGFVGGGLLEPSLGIGAEMGPRKPGAGEFTLPDLIIGMERSIGLPIADAVGDARCCPKMIDAIGNVGDTIRRGGGLGGGGGAGAGFGLGYSETQKLIRGLGLPTADMGMRKPGGGLPDFGAGLQLPGAEIPRPGLGTGAEPGEGKGGGSVTITVNNPQPRAAENDVQRALRNLQYMGVLNPLSGGR